MCVAVIGGVRRLEQHYLREAERMGIDLRLFNEPGAEMANKLCRADAVIIFTNMVSHNGRRLAKKAAKIHGIPVFMHHACGLCTLRECLNCLRILSDAPSGGRYS
jgi:hypothetical protein